MPKGVYRRTPEIVASLQAAAKARRTDTGWCQVAGCERASSRKRANICEMHYGRWRRTGQYTLPGPRKRLKEPSYYTAHTRVRYERGRAATYLCIDCGEPARHWSFAWRRVPHDEWLWSEDNGLRPYSGNGDHYDARCAMCAAWYDKGYLPDGAWIPRKEQATT
jgi:hypothetical protein